MKIKSLQLKNFKRFTDLTLQDIPEEARLVLLIGSNGSGKSSVFDAYQVFVNHFSKTYKNPELEYRKSLDSKIEIKLFTYEYGEEGLIDGNWQFKDKVDSSFFYGSPSFRQVPRLSRKSMGSAVNIQDDTDRALTFIDREERFENDLEHLFGRLLKEFFKTDKEISKIKKDVIDPINESLSRIFGDLNGTKLKLVSMIPPIEGKTAEIIFTKGSAVFHYNLLSAGEKEVFNILINLVARGEYYTNTVYFFDEIDLHLNTRLQFNFLKEIVQHWIPANCQLWTASHSLGFIDYAMQSNEAVIFDFDDFDFDKPRILVPEPKDNPNLYEIAVDKELLPRIFQGLKIVFVENTDKSIYGSLAIDKTVFIADNNRNSVYHKVKDGEFSGIVDRDFLSDEDIEIIEENYRTLKVLRYYSIENYLYHPDNLEEYYKKEGKPYEKEKYIADLIQEKNKVKDDLIPNLTLNRTGYPYFVEPKFNGNPFQNRFKSKTENGAESRKISDLLNSNELELFYKVLPMKTYATQLLYRQHISRTELAKTDWFKNKIEDLLK